ncbi:MAG: rhodanese-like domain-containing protein [Pseudomonadales bacterium]
MTQPSSIESISTARFRELQQSPDCFVIDVREIAEYAAGCESGSCNWPLSNLSAEKVAELVQANQLSPDKKLVLLCARGMRARQAAEKLQALVPNPLLVVEGGRAALHPLPAGAPLPIERQVRIAAGSLVLLGVLLSWLIHPAFIGISAFVGAGLVFAGVTDWCGMAMLLMKMPWNQPK